MDTTIVTTLRLGLATSLAALCLGATACGSETAATDPPVQAKPAQQESRVSPRYDEHPPGSFHADTYCRSHPNPGVIRCGSSGHVPQRRVGHAWS